MNRQSKNIIVFYIVEFVITCSLSISNLYVLLMYVVKDINSQTRVSETVKKILCKYGWDGGSNIFLKINHLLKKLNMSKYYGLYVGKLTIQM